MERKRLGLLRELVPNAALIAILLNPNSPDVEIQLKDLTEAASALGQKIHIVRANNEQDIDAAFTSFSTLKPAALLVGANPFFISRREKIVSLATHYRIPAIYEVREFVAAGGLMSYGTSLIDAYRQVGIYTGRVLKGEKPANLPVFQMTKFEFLINLKAARALGLDDVPGALSARATRSSSEAPLARFV